MKNTIHTISSVLCALAIALPFSAGLHAEEVVIHAGMLLASPGSKPKAEQSIVIVDGIIRAIRDGYIDADSTENPARIIDLSKQFVMPGFIDLHVHLSGQYGDNKPNDDVTQSDADVALNAAMYANRTLLAGFTTLRDLGSRGEPLYALRDAIRDNKVPGPRLLVSGPAITPTGGHGDEHGYRAEILELLTSSAVCDGADDCRRAVRQAVKLGADVIKVTATGGVLSNTATGTGQQFTDAELKAIAETAHALGRKVTAHAHAKEGIIAAANAGFDSIEHAMWADEETLKLLKRLDVWVIPTVYPITYVGDTPEKMRQGPLKNLPPASMTKLLALGQQPKDMTRLAHQMGVKIALGTDSAISPHGENAHEFIEYVSAGMTPMEALQAGTVNAAEAAGISNVTGSIVVGKAADIVGLGSSPLDSIDAVLDVRFVMRDGSVFKDEK
ncbi:MAG: amidohydrolase family protein [Xanthomonadales bacterium]|nr:amidohydrolase family protein [Xanthomonadales bacterium]